MVKLCLALLVYARYGERFKQVGSKTVVEKQEVTPLDGGGRMVSHWSRVVATAALASILMSCASPKIPLPYYKYGNVTYKTPEEALAAQRAVIDAGLNKIPPVDRPVGGSAVVILPSIAYATKNFVKSRGPEHDPGKAQAENYIATTIVNSLRARGEMIKKRRLFDRVVITSSDDPERVTLPADVALYMFKKDGKGQWFLKNQKANAPVMTALPEIPITLPPLLRDVIWLENVEKMSQSE
jgi:hypothetical protein